MPGDRAEADRGVVLADLPQPEGLAPGAREHDAALGDAGLELLVPAGQSIGHRNDADTGLLHPVEVEPSAQDLLALEVAQLLPRELRAEIVSAVADDRDQRLVEVLEPLLQARELPVDVGRGRHALDRIHGAEGQHDLEGVHRHLGRLEAVAEAADIDDAVLHALEGVEHLHDGAAVALDEVDLVLGLRLDGLLELRLEEVLHQPGIDHGRRMAGGDTDVDRVGAGGRRADGDGGAQERGGGHAQNALVNFLHSSRSPCWPATLRWMRFVFRMQPKDCAGDGQTGGVRGYRLTPAFAGSAHQASITRP